MTGETSLVGRVAWGSALAASAAALVSALATIAFASYLVGRAEDRRLEEAAVTFAAELGPAGRDLAAVRTVHRAESEEMEHTGLLFAVYDDEGRFLVGDRRLPLPSAPGCVTTNLRVCREPASSGLSAVVGGVSGTSLPPLLGAAVAAALLAAALAWMASRPISRLVVAPLTRLRERIEALEIEAISSADLGPAEHVSEVDALRSTLALLIERVERALSQAQRFAANAAHELRTPLTAVRGELELLAETIAEPSLRADALRAQERLTELSTLIERLLILALPARGATDAHEVVSLRDLLEDAVALLPPGDRARIQLSEADVSVRGDAALLATMVSNALSNGLKFGHTVTTDLDRAEGAVILRVDDDGPGLDASERERVFEPFYRAAHAERRRVPGHGLGLALIRHIAETHGGGAAFTAPRERGARLEIWLPPVT